VIQGEAIACKAYDDVQIFDALNRNPNCLGSVAKRLFGGTPDSEPGEPHERFVSSCPLDDRKVERPSPVKSVAKSDPVLSPFSVDILGYVTKSVAHSMI
jgi:hypothetical protein